MTFVKLKLTTEKVILILISLSFLIGLWHALPMLTVIGDEMYFVGGVLRAMEAKSLLPGVGDMPYGTLNFYLNYILIGLFILTLFPFFGFNLLKLKLFLVNSPEIIYFVSRLGSFILAVILLFLVYQIFKKEISDSKNRILLLFLLFGNLVTNAFLHTAKMWVLTTFLVFTSFYFLYLALSEVHKPHLKRNIFLTILFAFLALANFPFNIYALINIPLLFILLKPDKKLSIKIISYIFISGTICLVFIALNFANLKDLFNIHLSSGQESGQVSLNFFESFFIYLKKIIAYYTLIILTLLLVIKDKIKNKKLFLISLLYLVSYLILLSLIANHSRDIYSNPRHLLALAFFLILILASFNLRFKKIYYPILIISVVYFIPALYFLAVPTTYNQARAWIVKNLSGQSVIINNQIHSLELPKNKDSYNLIQDNFCSSKCSYTQEYNLNQHFKPTILDEYSQANLGLKSDYYIVNQQMDTQNYNLITSFTNSPQAEFSIEEHFGNYFDLDFFRLKNLGPDIYIYQSK